MNKFYTKQNIISINSNKLKKEKTRIARVQKIYYRFLPEDFFEEDLLPDPGFDAFDLLLPEDLVTFLDELRLPDLFAFKLLLFLGVDER